MGNQCSACNCKKDEAQSEFQLNEAYQHSGAPDDRRPNKVNAGGLNDSDNAFSNNCI